MTKLIIMLSLLFCLQTKGIQYAVCPRGVVLAIHAAASNNAIVTSMPPAGGDVEGGVDRQGQRKIWDREDVRRVTSSCR